MSEKELIIIESFGVMTGLKFDDGGYAEIFMSSTDIDRILKSLKDYESSKSKYNDRVLEAIDILRKHFFSSFIQVKCEVVIGKYRVEFSPVPRSL